MNRVTSFLIGLIVGSFGVYLALKYHVVRADDGVHLVPKVEATFEDSYVDIRRYDFNDWRKHSVLVSSLTRAEKTDLMRRSAGNAIHSTVDELFKTE